MGLEPDPGSFPNDPPAAQSPCEKPDQRRRGASADLPGSSRAIAKPRGLSGNASGVVARSDQAGDPSQADAAVIRIAATKNGSQTANRREKKEPFGAMGMMGRATAVCRRSRLRCVHRSRSCCSSRIGFPALWVGVECNPNRRWDPAFPG